MTLKCNERAVPPLDITEAGAQAIIIRDLKNFSFFFFGRKPANRIKCLCSYYGIGAGSLSTRCLCNNNTIILYDFLVVTAVQLISTLPDLRIGFVCLGPTCQRTSLVVTEEESLIVYDSIIVDIIIERVLYCFIK